MIVWLDGDWVPESEAHIAIDDRGFLYADGIFETARLFGAGYFRFDSHMERLAEGARTLRLQIPEAQLLRDIADGLAERNPMQHGSFRITVTRGREGAGSPTVIATLKRVPDDWQARARRGWTLITAEVRHPDPRSMPLHVKALGRLHGLIAKQEARDANVDDALLLSPEGMIAEGPTWNVFWRTGSVLRTPAVEVGVLDGVTRRTIIELAPAMGVQVEEGAWPRAVLDEADEVFATMSSLGPVPVRRLDSRMWTAEPEFTSALAERYWKLVADEVAAGA